MAEVGLRWCGGNAAANRTEDLNVKVCEQAINSVIQQSVVGVLQQTQTLPMTRDCFELRSGFLVFRSREVRAFVWKGKSYPSLSKVAFAITGTPPDARLRPSVSHIRTSLCPQLSPFPGNGISRRETKALKCPHQFRMRHRGDGALARSPVHAHAEPSPAIG